MKVRERIKKTLKLIRDAYPIMDEHHRRFPYDATIAPPNLKSLLLIGKMHEEVEEIRADMAHPEEYGDLLQVMRDCAYANGVLWSDVERWRADKWNRLGGYSEGKILVREAGEREIEVVDG
jgi:predicted house-cleaning noncanonical NTP pyrophosphatase (MazG superfamily)